MTQVLDFLWGSLQYKHFAFLGLIQRDLWGPLRPGKLSGQGLLQYSFQGTIYAKSALTHVLVVLGGFSENRFFRHLPDFLDVRFRGSYPRPLRPAGTQWGHQTVDMTNTSHICQNCDDASPRFCFETKLYIRLLISVINVEGSTGSPTAWPNHAIVAFDRPYPGVQYIQNLRWRKSWIFCGARFNISILRFWC